MGDSPPYHLEFCLWGPSFDETINGETNTIVSKSINRLAPIYPCKSCTINVSRDIVALKNLDADLYVPFMTTKNG